MNSAKALSRSGNARNHIRAAKEIFAMEQELKQEEINNANEKNQDYLHDRTGQ